MSEVGELAAVLGPGSVLLVQASTPAEARLIRERIAAAGGALHAVIGERARRVTIGIGVVKTIHHLVG